MALKKISTTVTASGAGWSAVRTGSTALIELSGWDGAPLTLPWPATVRARGLVCDAANATYRCIAQGNTLTVYGAPATTSLYGQIIYIA